MMSRRDYDPGSTFEDEGIPDLQDGTPEQQQAVDPQEAPLPTDEPTMVDKYGTTATEQREPEPLEERLRQEEPDIGRPPIRTVSPPKDDNDQRSDPGGGSEPAWPSTEEGAAGRLVEPDSTDEGDRQQSAATDAGADGGGFSAEERAVHETDRP